MTDEQPAEEAPPAPPAAPPALPPSLPLDEFVVEPPAAAPPAAPPAVPEQDPVVEAAVEEAPVEEVSEAVKEAPVVEQPSEDTKEEPVPEPVPEPVHVAEVTGDYNPESAWKEIAKDKNQIDWYTVELKKGLQMEFDKAGAGGLAELRDYLVLQKTKVLFALLRVTSGDSHGSSRAKFVFIRFIGSKVGIMLKAKVGTVGTRADDMFPVKHLTLELSDDEFLDKQTSMASITKEFLRVGGAHKPEFYEYGPGQKHAL